eukprot:4968486-Prymnesium_polylepis.1
MVDECTAPEPCGAVEKVWARACKHAKRSTARRSLAGRSPAGQNSEFRIQNSGPMADVVARGGIGSLRTPC